MYQNKKNRLKTLPDNKDKDRMDYLMSWLKSLFVPNSNFTKRSQSQNAIPTTQNVMGTTNKIKNFSIQLQANDAYNCHGWWEVILLRKIPNDIQFYSIGVCIYDTDDISTVFSRLCSTVNKLAINSSGTDADEEEYLKSLNPATIYFREIPDGVTIQRLRHYLLTPSMRFLILSDNSDDIQTFVLQSGFKHWVTGVSPFSREFKWPSVFSRLLVSDQFPSYVSDENEGMNLIRGGENFKQFENDDPLSDHERLKMTKSGKVFSDIVFHSYELNNDEDTQDSQESHSSSCSSKEDYLAS
jgi:hypothetical protein